MRHGAVVVVGVAAVPEVRAAVEAVAEAAAKEAKRAAL
jgi:hypothetical protein